MSVGVPTVYHNHLEHSGHEEVPFHSLFTVIHDVPVVEIVKIGKRNEQVVKKR